MISFFLKHIFENFIFLVIAILALKNVLILYTNRSRDFIKLIGSLEKKRIRHIVAISCYKEPVELIATSIQSVANQSEVNRITMVISFEERTPNKEEKCKYLENKFKDSGFERIIFTIHPFDLPNEIPGKCSNSNYGLRMAVKQMNIIDDDMDNILVTTCDSDSKFPREYIAALTWKYLKENQPALTTIYQSPLFYNWKLDDLSFVTRVTGLLRSLLMLGALIPFNINTMSIFSYSLSLAKKGNFIHPSYQMDDIICLIRWMGVTQQRIRISIIPVPVISGPTSGETIGIEIMEWARQARRWTIGAAEVFHYFIIKAKHMPKFAAISWGFVFVIYYGILLCTAGLFSLTSMLSMVLFVKDVPPTISYIMYGLFGLQMLTFVIAFIIDGLIGRLMKVNECIFILRNVFHFLSTPFVLLAYSLVELYALHEVLIFGKKVCKHGASKKPNLPTNS
jgi:cellulose synthase/poly-beta-1,6-N-acetylglucosamine synthase-like glycosyltransferase